MTAPACSSSRATSRTPRPTGGPRRSGCSQAGPMPPSRSAWQRAARRPRLVGPTPSAAAPRCRPQAARASTTGARRPPGARACSSSCARSMAMTDAAQPMPPRWYVLMACLNLKWLTTAADSEGTGLNVQQLVMSASTSRGFTPVLSSTCARARAQPQSQPHGGDGGLVQQLRATRAASVAASRRRWRRALGVTSGAPVPGFSVAQMGCKFLLGIPSLSEGGEQGWHGREGASARSDGRCCAIMGPCSTQSARQQVQSISDPAARRRPTLSAPRKCRALSLDSIGRSAHRAATAGHPSRGPALRGGAGGRARLLHAREERELCLRALVGD